MKSILKFLLAVSLLFMTQYGISQSEVQSEGQSNSAEKVDEKLESVEGETLEGETKEEEVPQLFQKYEWLNNLVNREDCEGVKVYLKSKSGTDHNRFIIIVDGDSRKTYNPKGEIWCTTAKNIDCEEFYELKTIDDEWSCDEEKPKEK